MKEKLYRIEEAKIPEDWEAEVKKLTEAQKKDLIAISENPIYLYLYPLLVCLSAPLWGWQWPNSPFLVLLVFDEIRVSQYNIITCIPLDLAESRRVGKNVLYRLKASFSTL